MHWCYITIALCIVLAWIIRAIAKQLTEDDVTLLHVYEFLANIISSVFVMELNVMTSEYGITSLSFMFTFVLHLFIRHYFLLSVNGYGTILTFVDDYYINQRYIKFSLQLMFTILVTQAVGVLCGQWVGKFMWSFEDHVHVHSGQEACFATLAVSYTWYHALMLEAFGTFIGNSIDFVTPDKLKPIVRAVVTLCLFQMFGYASGLWMHPMFATIFTFRCKGHSGDLIHLFVFWLGPIIGFALSWELRYLIQQNIQPATEENIQPATEEKKEQ